MRVFPLAVFIATGCTAPPPTPPPQLEPGIPTALVAAMERLTGAECPVPPMLYVLDGTWWDGSYGTVVAVDGQMVAIRKDNPQRWPDDTLHMLVTIEARGPNPSIKGDVVTVRERADVLIGRFFPRPKGSPAVPALGDEASVDYSTTESMRAEWRGKR